MTEREKLWAEYERIAAACDRHDTEGHRLDDEKFRAVNAIIEYDRTRKETAL